MLSLGVPAEAFLLAFVLTAPYVAWLRPRPLAFVLGAAPVAGAALVIEALVQGGLRPLYAAAIMLVVIAPITEELLKFLASGAAGANYSAAAGAGIGFAATENGVYFLVAWGEPTSFLLVLIAVRAFTDPLLHTAATTLGTLSWHGRPFGLPAGILLHSLWNLSTLYGTYVDPVAGLLLLTAASLAVLGILVYVRRDPAIEEILSNHWRMSPISGELRVAGAG